MLRWRLLSTAILVGLLSALVWGDLTWGAPDSLGRPGLLLAPLALLAVVLGSLELADLFRSGGLPASSFLCAVGGVVPVSAALMPILWRDYPADCLLGQTGWLGLGAALAVAAVFTIEMVQYREPGNSVTRIGLALFVLGYLGILMGFLPWLRLVHDNGWGMLALLSMVLIVKVSDAGAYVVGKSIGRHRLAPTLSPGKTVEGLCGALVGGMVAAWFSFAVLSRILIGPDVELPAWWAIAVYGVVVTLAGMLGDLAESLIKRDMKRKDASHLMPGLGGALDVLDSIVAAAPAAYVCWVVGLVGPA